MIIPIIKTVLIVSGISGFLAALLVWAEAVFANYGECEIDINNGKKKLKVKGGSSLLSTLSANKIYVPSACGGRGSCGFCKVRIHDGAGPLLPTERPYLSAQEIQDNVRLSCQIKIKNDLAIQIPEEIFNIARFQAKVLKIEDYTYDIKGVTFQLMEPQQIHFKAGQYMQLEAPAYPGNKKPVSRAYSISSPPEKTNQIQLIIRKVPDGICTTYVHDFMQEGDTAYLTGPFGDFYIRDTDADMIFIAGGSGKAPIKSMVQHLATEQSQRRMIYFFGARTQKDLYLTDAFHGFEKQMVDFSFVPVLSEAEENWQGKTGYITPYLQEAVRDPQKTEAYLCGSPGMIAAMEKELLRIGILKENIYYDSFA